MLLSQAISCRTEGRGFYNLTDRIQALLPEAGEGLCHLFVHHTSASLVITENADPAVHEDLECFISALAPDGDPRFSHVAEGPDDMPAHIRSVLTQTELNVPVQGGRLALGVWQGIYLWEHRTSPHTRKVTCTLLA